jgi:hypothetical protein
MLKNILAVVGVAALVMFIAIASPAMGELLAPNSTMNSDAWPPLRFRGEMVGIVAFVDPAAIDGICGKAPAPWKTEACTDATMIVLPNPCSYPTTDDYARLACHEKGHRLGWPGSHGDARARL